MSMTVAREAYLLSPYRPPTSYPVSLSAEEASSWLCGYLALWHPAVLAVVQRPPQPASSYDHDQPTAGAIYAVPEGPHLYQPDDWPDRVRQAGGVAFSAGPDFRECQRLLLDRLAESGSNDPLLHASDRVVRFFRAIGYGYLLVESLFDAMDHEHLLDTDGFWADLQQAVAALRGSAAAGNGGGAAGCDSGAPEPFTDAADATTAVRDCLKNAAEKLRAAREVLNTSTIHLLDFAIPDRSRLDGPWPGSLSRGLPLTLLAAGELLERQAEEAPERFAELTARLQASASSPIDLACGAYREREDALMPLESQWWNLRKARAITRSLVGMAAETYGRKRSAFHPQLPGWLLHAGYKNAILVSFDGALSPARNAVIINWPGPDGKTIDAFGREPQSAADPLTFFNFVYHLQQALTHDSAPTIALAHRGEPAAIGYEELLTLSELGEVLGRWTCLSQYLSEYHYGEYLGASGADDFFSDYLDDRVTNLHRPEPVSGFARLYRLRRQLDDTFTLAALHRSLTAPGQEDQTAVEKLEFLEDEIEGRGVNVGAAATDELAEQLQSQEQQWGQRLAARIQSRSAEGQPGFLILNPFAFTRRVGLEIPGFSGPIPVTDPVKAAQFDGEIARLVVEVPALGFAWIPRHVPGAVAPRSRMKTAEGMIVRNEYFEAELDPATGALRAFRESRTRLNRLGMQLIFNPGSKMRATEITTTLAGAAVGEIKAHGELLDNHDKRLAGFTQTLRAWIGRPALEITVEFDVEHLPTGYPWHSYYGARFGWRDERSAIFRGVNGMNTRSTYTRPVSPDYLEIRLGKERTFIFTGGLPFWQRHGSRMADLILLPEGEQCRRFEFLIAADRDYPMPTALGWTATTPVIATEKGPPPGGASGWLASLDLPSLFLTALRPERIVVDGEEHRRAVSGRFLECAGFSGNAELRFAHDPRAAQLIDGEGSVVQVLGVHQGGIPLEFSAHEFFRVRAEWL